MFVFDNFDEVDPDLVQNVWGIVVLRQDTETRRKTNWGFGQEEVDEEVHMQEDRMEKQVSYDHLPYEGEHNEEARAEESNDKSATQDVLKEEVSLDLSSLLFKFRGRLCTDLRDKIFALIGLTDTDLALINLAPDYHSSHKELYIRLAKSLLECSEILDFLSILRGNTELSHTLPSWVVDWPDTSTTDSLLWVWAETENLSDSPYMATGQSATNDDHLSFNESNILTASGCHLDRLASLSSIYPKARF
ncbi:hypothetical protein N431DRAFT_475216 [Stipitochalara longipes BDJ]|nr:hypothetical protein N431DRAFT_475216 [Stipitochalara longipes BDJ]